MKCSSLSEAKYLPDSIGILTEGGGRDAISPFLDGGENAHGRFTF